MKVDVGDADYVPTRQDLMLETLRWVFGVELETIHDPKGRQVIVELVQWYGKSESVFKPT
jgi:hypothetical protein